MIFFDNRRLFRSVCQLVGQIGMRLGVFQWSPLKKLYGFGAEITLSNLHPPNVS